MKQLNSSSAGLGLRRSLLTSLQEAALSDFDFLECAPDNWINIGGALAEALKELTQRFPLTCHGLSLSLGGVRPLDTHFLQQTRQFLDQYQVDLYSEHLSYCTDSGHLYDLLPLPFTDEAVHHVAAHIRQAQDMLGRRIAVENISYYAAPFQALSEVDFINAVLQEADCDLLLDINNIYVNSINHNYNPIEFLQKMPANRIVSYHIAGHFDEADDLKIDTHGMPVKSDVWDLLKLAYQSHGVKPTLLERDFNFPPFNELLAEITIIRDLQKNTTIKNNQHKFNKTTENVSIIA